MLPLSGMVSPAKSIAATRFFHLLLVPQPSSYYSFTSLRSSDSFSLAILYLVAALSSVFFFAEIVYFTGLVLLDKFLSLYYSQQEARLCNKLLSFVSAILFLIILGIWIVDPLWIGQHPVWLYSLFIFIPAFVLACYFIIKFNPSIKSISQEEMKSFSSFSIIVLVTNIIQFIAFRADYWLISIFYDHAEVGVYAQASKFAQLLWIIPGILAGLVVPALKNADQKLTDANFMSVCRVTFYAHLFMSLVLIGISLLIYLFFLPKAYFEGFVSLLLMIPGYLLFVITTILAAWFSANRLLKVNLVGSVICCALMILVDVLLIPSLSYRGAAIANLVAYSITTIYFIYRATSLLDVRSMDFFTIRRSDFDLFSGRILIEGRQNT